jgi:hypothetical protein
MIRHVSLVAAFLSLGCASMIAQEAQTMTNADVVKMVQSGVSEANIITAIKAATPNFEITNEAIVELRKQKVPENAIMAMIRRQVLENNARRKAKATAHHGPATGPYPKWEVEAHGGVSRTKQTGGYQLPPSAIAYSLYGTGFQGDSSIRVSSWYFGDGATLIGSTPLDSILTRSVVEPPGRMYGFRASRAINRRFAAEFTFDRTGKLAITNDALNVVEGARAGFNTAWARLNIPGNTPTSSVSTISPDAGAQTFATGAAVMNLPQIHRVHPYVTAGLGVLFTGSGTPTVNLAGSYGGPTAPETDTVHLTFLNSNSRAFTQVVGIGVKVYLTKHVGLRVDLRNYFYQNAFSTVLDATHTNTANAAWVVKASGGTSVPFLQLKTGPGLSAYSTLSGPNISGLKTFFGSGNQSQIPLTVGLFWRF